MNDRTSLMVRHTVEYFASASDAFLQDFESASLEDDVEGMIMASVSLWQLMSSLMYFFKGITKEGLVVRQDLQGAAQKRAEVVIRSIHKRMRDIANGASKEPGKTDPSMN